MAGNEKARTACGFECPICGGRCCTGSAGSSGLCFLHDPDLPPGERADRARARGYESLADCLRARAAEGAPLHGLRLAHAALDGAVLSGADLRGADLPEALLTNSRLDGARLGGANLYNADLRGARLAGAELTDACVDWADLRGARGLRAEDCRRIRPTVPGFRAIKRMFQDADDRDGASEFAFREKRQQRRNLWAERGRWFRSAAGVRLFGRWLIHCGLEVSCGHFESYLLPLIWSVMIIVCCGFVYAAGQGIEPSIERGAPVTERRIDLNEAVYFSAVTFTTLGYGDYRPRPGPWRLVAGAEAFAGAFLISVFVVTLAHRYVVR